MSKTNQSSKKKKAFLGVPIEQFRIDPNITADEIMRRMERISFQGRNLALAHRIWKRMLADDVLIFLGVAGAVSAGGLRLAIAHLIERRAVDCLVSTGANLYHDLHETRGRKHFVGSPAVDDRALQEAHIDRVYDTFVDEDEFIDNDNWPHQLYIREARRMVSDHVMTQHDCQGRRIAKDSVGLAAYTMDSHNVQRIVDARGFALDRGLSPGGAYLAVADTEGLAVAWVVSAAHRDRLEPYLWRYPLVGDIPYRGYFDRGRADAFARQLGGRDLDIRVTEAAGYSTLGWFDDPLPSGLLALDDVALVTVVLHEIVHTTLFVPGHMDFNESIATALSERLAVEFFTNRAGPDAVKASRRMALSLARSRFYDRLAGRLRTLFARAASGDWNGTRTMEERSVVYSDAAAEFEAAGFGDRTSFLAGQPDNASFLAAYRYHRGLAELQAWFERYGGQPGWARYLKAC